MISKFDYNSEVYVYADEFYIDQVFTNYFTNAIKNTKSIDGITEIIINIKKDTKNNKARVSVFNTGEQISEENLEKIWGVTKWICMMFRFQCIVLYLGQ